MCQLRGIDGVRPGSCRGGAGRQLPRGIHRGGKVRQIHRRFGAFIEHAPGKRASAISVRWIHPDFPRQETRAQSLGVHAIRHKLYCLACRSGVRKIRVLRVTGRCGHHPPQEPGLFRGIVRRCGRRRPAPRLPDSGQPRLHRLPGHRIRWRGYPLVGSHRALQFRHSLGERQPRIRPRHRPGTLRRRGPQCHRRQPQQANGQHCQQNHRKQHAHQRKPPGALRHDSPFLLAAGIAFHFWMNIPGLRVYEIMESKWLNGAPVRLPGQHSPQRERGISRQNPTWGLEKTAWAAQAGNRSAPQGDRT